MAKVELKADYVVGGRFSWRTQPGAKDRFRVCNAECHPAAFDSRLSALLRFSKLALLWILYEPLCASNSERRRFTVTTSASFGLVHPEGRPDRMVERS